MTILNMAGFETLIATALALVISLSIIVWLAIKQSITPRMIELRAQPKEERAAL